MKLAESRISWLWLLLISGIAGSGCGRSAPPPPPPPPPAAPAPVAVKVETVKPAAPPPGANAANANAAANAAAAAAATAPPGEHPANVFELVATGERFDVGQPAPEVKPTDRFIADPTAVGTITSTTFFVETSASTSAGGGSAKPGLKLPSGFAAIPESGYSPEGYPRRIRCEKDDSILQFVPGGNGTFGARAGVGGKGKSPWGPEVAVTLDPFYMDVYETTVGQILEYREDQKSKKKSIPQFLNDSAPKNYPALGLNYKTTIEYLRWAGKELPTEAEYEFAASGPEHFMAPWGDGRPLWSIPRSRDQITEIGSYPQDRSPFGIFDLAGNAREWTSDFFSEKGHVEALAESRKKPLKNWNGTKKGVTANHRVVKGNGPNWEVWYREGREMSEKHKDLGFRGVVRLENKPSETEEK